MKDSKLALYALVQSAGIFLYTAGVACFLFNGDKLFGKAENFWMPLVMLLLFVFSAAVVGLLFFGRAIHMYLSGLKKEAFKLVFYNLFFLFLIILIVFIALLV